MNTNHTSQTKQPQHESSIERMVHKVKGKFSKHDSKSEPELVEASGRAGTDSHTNTHTRSHENLMNKLKSPKKEHKETPISEVSNKSTTNSNKDDPTSTNPEFPREPTTTPVQPDPQFECYGAHGIKTPIDKQQGATLATDIDSNKRDSNYESTEWHENTPLASFLNEHAKEHEQQQEHDTPLTTFLESAQGPQTTGQQEPTGQVKEHHNDEDWTHINKDNPNKTQMDHVVHDIKDNDSLVPPYPINDLPAETPEKHQMDHVVDEIDHLKRETPESKETPAHAHMDKVVHEIEELGELEHQEQRDLTLGEQTPTMGASPTFDEDATTETTNPESGEKANDKMKNEDSASNHETAGNVTETVADTWNYVTGQGKYDNRVNSAADDVTAKIGDTLNYITGKGSYGTTENDSATHKKDEAAAPKTPKTREMSKSDSALPTIKPLEQSTSHSEVLPGGLPPQQDLQMKREEEKEIFVNPEAKLQQDKPCKSSGESGLYI